MQEAGTNKDYINHNSYSPFYTKDLVFTYIYTQIPTVPIQFIPPPKGKLQLLHNTKHDAL